jgi:hypothetical protein
MYDTEEDARDAINGHAAATYHSFGPYKVGEALSRAPEEVWHEVHDLLQQAMSDVAMGEFAAVDEDEVERLERERDAEFGDDIEDDVEENDS